MLRPALALLLCAAPTQIAQAAATLSLDPPVQAVVYGQEFELALLASADIGDLSCFAVTIDFDPTLLEYVSSSEGSLFSASPDPSFFQHSLDAQSNDVLSDCLLGFGTSVLAPGEIARIRLRAIDDGAGSITIQGAVLRDIDRAVIPDVQWVHASVNVTPTTTPPMAGNLRLIVGPNPSSGPVWLRAAGALPNFRGELRIHDAQGRLVHTQPVDGERLRQGTLRWDGRDAAGRAVAGGIYFAQLRQGELALAQAKLLRLE